MSAKKISAKQLFSPKVEMLAKATEAYHRSIFKYKKPDGTEGQRFIGHITVVSIPGYMVRLFSDGRFVGDFCGSVVSQTIHEFDSDEDYDRAKDLRLSYA